MELEIILEPAQEGGYTVSCPILQGCISEGDSREEALVNIHDAISLYLQAIKKEEEILISQVKGSELLKVAVNV